jgi:hypothetical protein
MAIADEHDSIGKWRGEEGGGGVTAVMVDALDELARHVRRKIDRLFRDCILRDVGYRPTAESKNGLDGLDRQL